jgi:hypothetical protein
MVPASFTEANIVLARPPDMTADECDCLDVLRTVTPLGRPVVISCWKVTAEDLAEIQRTGRIWLTVYGERMPPVALTGARPFA